MPTIMTSINNIAKPYLTGNNRGEKNYQTGISAPNGCPVGLSYAESVEFLIELSKGRISQEQGAWFYGLFLDREWPIYKRPQDREEVRQRLVDAWWVEEDDIRQEIFFYTFYLDVHYHRHALYLLCVWIRDWLINKQKVLNVKPEGWEERYRAFFFSREEIEPCYFSYSILLENIGDLTQWEAFLFWLRYVVRMGPDKVADLIYYTPRSCWNFYRELTDTGKVDRSLVDAITTGS